ncbi:MAG: carboxylating nicotinate-nucleotide diphosphorylase [Methanocorpusculum sp.]|nr:carboxylating nicotinate-nucleotide diphosphorylase [Methanocorpusculum sp.]
MERKELLKAFLAEDAVERDITSQALLENTYVSARIEAREEMTLSGIEECVEIFGLVGVAALPEKMDGEKAAPYEVILRLHGRVHSILAAERTALNLLGRMSGIASAADAAGKLAREINDHVRVAGTRKTAPGLRYFDKKAITAGGGLPHRYDLEEAFLIKDTHRSFIPVDEAVRRCREYSPKKVIDCEVESVEDALLAAKAGADTIMFDNMSPQDIAGTISALSEAGLRDKVMLEISGGIKAETIAAYKGLDIDIISMGALTHSVRCADVSLEIE